MDTVSKIGILDSGTELVEMDILFCLLAAIATPLDLEWEVKVFTVLVFFLSPPHTWVPFHITSMFLHLALQCILVLHIYVQSGAWVSVTHKFNLILQQFIAFPALKSSKCVDKDYPRA